MLKSFARFPTESVFLLCSGVIYIFWTLKTYQAFSGCSAARLGSLVHARSHAVQGPAAVGTGLRTQEDSHSGGALQTRQWSHQGERAAPGDD